MPNLNILETTKTLTCVTWLFIYMCVCADFRLFLQHTFELLIRKVLPLYCPLFKYRCMRIQSQEIICTSIFIQHPFATCIYFQCHTKLKEHHLTHVLLTAGYLAIANYCILSLVLSLITLGKFSEFMIKNVILTRYHQ